jgi:hypothetical protein
MALSVYSQTFQDTVKEAEELVASGEIATKAELSNYVSNKGIEPTEYMNALEKMQKGLSQGMSSDDFRPIDIPLIGNVGRTLGRFAGETVGGFVDFVDAFTPEGISEAVSGVASELEEALPEELVQGLDAIFDPYHGEGAAGVVENMAGTVGSYLVPSMAAVKGVNLALKANKLARSPASRSLTRKKLMGLEKGARTKRIKDMRRAEYLKTRGAQGVGVAAGITAVEDPDESIVNFLVDSFPESTKFMERLYIDPNDSEAEKYLQNLINNLGLGLAISPFYIANALRGNGLKSALAATKPIPEALRNSETAKRLPDTPSFWSAPIATTTRYLGEMGTALRGTDEATMAAAIARDNELQAVLREVEGLNNSLRATSKNKYDDTLLNDALQGDSKALNSLDNDTRNIVTEMRNKIDTASTEYGYGLNPAQNKTKLNKINRQIENKVNQISKTKQGTKKRENLENSLAALIKRKEATESDGLKATIDSKIGVYMTRGYDYFDDPDFAKDLLKRYNDFKSTGKDDKGVFVSALDSIKKQAGVDDAEAKELLDKLLRTGEKPADIFGGFMDLSQKLTTAKSYKKRDPLTEEVRSLLGEIKDPYRNFANTMSNLAKYTAETKFLKEIENTLLDDKLIGKGVVSTSGPAGRATVRLDEVLNARLKNVFGESTSVVTRPLKNIEDPADVFVSREYADLIKNGLKVMAPDDKVMRGWMVLKGASQASQTVGSVTTHGRNTLGNTIMLAANGMMPIGRSVFSGASDAWKGIMKSGDKEVGERLGKYQRLGIIGSNVDLNVMKTNLRNASKDPDKFFDNLAKGKGVLSSVKKAALKPVKFATDVYQLEDDMFKIAHFENTLKYLKKSKAYKGMPEEDIIREAAQRTRDLMPNYSLVNKSIKGLSKYLVGDYMAFPAEMIRVTKNIGKYALKDLNSGDAELMKAGAKRLAGMTSVAVAPMMAADYSANYYGITDDQKESLNNLDSPWNYNKDRIFLSGIDTDKNGHKGVDQMSFGYIDPFSYVKSNALTAIELLASGMSDNEELSDAKFNKSMLSLLDGAVSPFLAPSMLTEALMESVAQGKEGKFGEAAGTLATVFTPGTIKLIQKRQQYNASKKLREPYGLEPLKKGLFSFSEGEVDVLAALGLKRERLDLTAGASFALKPVLQDIDRAGSDFNRLLQSPSLTEEYDMTDLLRLNTESGKNQINSAYIDAQKKRLYGYEQLDSLLDDYSKVFGPSYLADVENAYSLNRRKANLTDKQFQYIMDVENNIFNPVDFQQTDITKFESMAPMSIEDLFKIKDAYLGTQIK